ncbi:tetratricopeptide repeat protein, partial [Rudaea sp.]|uniref:tetratricopeptide repeat protein n=1 Tax=Rudaea sp. TaxID=2136325 RepID=UPI002ED64DB2
QARKADTEALLARSAQAFLTSIFEASSPDSAAGQRVTARELLDRGSERIDNELKDQPRLRGEMSLTLGSLYAQLGQYPQATRLLQGALATFDEAPASRLRAETELAGVDLAQSRLDDAERRLAFVLIRDPDPALRSRALVVRAQVHEKRGRFDEALADARAAFGLDASRGEAGIADQARDRQTEALVLARRGRFDQAATTFEQAIASARKFYGDDDTRVAQMRNDYAVALFEKGRTKEAEAELQRVLEIRRKRLGNEHPAVAETLQVLGAAQRGQDHLDESQASLEEALRIQRKAFGEQHADVANTLNSLGMLANARKQISEAERQFREALSIYKQIGLDDTAPAATTANNLASVLLQTGRYAEAEPLMQHALELHLKMLGEQHPMVMSDLNSLAQLEIRRDRGDQAIGYAQRAVRIADSPPNPPLIGAYVHLSYAVILNRAGKPSEALREADGAIATLEKLNPQDPRMATAWAARAYALLGLHRADEAQTLATRALEKRLQTAPNDDAGLAQLRTLLARIADARNQPAVAQRERKTAHDLLARVAVPDPDMLREIDRR